MATARSPISAALLAAALIASAAPATTPAPTRIAIFDFELEDYSAGVAADAPATADAAELAQVTGEVRQLLSQSGRYQPVDIGAPDAPAAKAHTLHECNGCDAGIARKLGATQSLVGVVRRISRTEYMVRLQVRDADTGAVVADANTGLRMGTLDSWTRGTKRLVEDQLLDGQEGR
ncbi:MAG TPA: DUF3280 domain-containing protein [Stellaceae bacterium]|nr:DUF3280 domain-containing protein [Stellaceae bacterium]